MQSSEQRSSSGTRFLLAAAALIVLASQLGVSATAMIGHSHHVKRQQPNMPQLTLNVEPSHGIEPTHAPAAQPPDYHFPVESSLFNFTCTIKHPQHRYKLSIIKEQTKLNGQKTFTDFIDPSDYKIHPNLDQSRFSIEYSEPTYLDPGAQFIRVSLLIKNLKIEDNGVYICKYSNIVKKINAIVYKVAVSEDISFRNDLNEPMTINSPAQVTCRVSNVYPRPRIVMTHSARENIQTSVVETDETISDDEFNPYRLYTIAATYKFTPSYSDNKQQITCTVTSQGTTNSTLSNVYTLSIEGTQIIEKDCLRGVWSKLDVADFQINCVFFANPRYEDTSYWETTEEASSSVATPAAAEASEADDVDSSHQTSVVSQIGTDATKHDESIPEQKLLQIREKEERGNYVYLIEDFSTGGGEHSGLYKAILKFKVIRPSDYKNYTFRLDNLSRTIGLYASEVQKDLSLRAENNSVRALVKSHSIVFILNLLLVGRMLFGLF